MRKSLPITILLLLLLVDSGAALEITFKESGAVADEVVRLADIAVIDEQTPLALDLGQQVIGQAPPLGATFAFESATIVRQLRAKVDPSQELLASGAATVTVSRRGVTIDSERIMAMISEFFAANKHRLPPAAISFTPTSPPLPFTVPEGELAVDVIPSNPNILGSSSFSLILRVDGKVVENMSVRGQLKAMAEIVVAAEPLRRGVVLEGQHLRQVAIDINDLAEPEYDPNRLLGRQLTRSLAAGTPILGSMVDDVPVVRRGQIVKMVVAKGLLQLTATGLAHSDGKIDQMIKVQNLSSNKTIHGRVTGPGLVEVLL